jgi:hypothetical protein
VLRSDLRLVRGWRAGRKQVSIPLGVPDKASSHITNDHPCMAPQHRPWLTQSLVCVQGVRLDLVKSSHDSHDHGGHMEWRAYIDWVPHREVSIMNRDAGNISLGNSGLWRCKYCDEEDSSCAFCLCAAYKCMARRNQKSAWNHRKSAVLQADSVTADLGACRDLMM